MAEPHAPLIQPGQHRRGPVQILQPHPQRLFLLVYPFNTGQFCQVGSPGTELEFAL